MKLNLYNHKRNLIFDFAIFDKNDNLFGLIEFDGVQHFKPIEIFGGDKALEYTKLRDNIKNEYCKNNNIKLLRIPYTEFKNLNDILNKFIPKELYLEDVS